MKELENHMDDSMRNSDVNMSGSNMREVYTPYITRGGRRIYARQYGLRAFHFYVKD